MPDTEAPTPLTERSWRTEKTKDLVTTLDALSKSGFTVYQIISEPGDYYSVVSWIEESG